MMELSGKAKEMMSYLPQYWHDFEEMKQILHTEGIEFESLTEEIKNVLRDAFITSSSEKRISQWEKQLKLPPIGTLQERRTTILQYFAVNLKLSPKVIESLVESFYNGARAKVEFSDSTIYVTIIPLPKHSMDELDFSMLLTQLEMRKPCHIGVNVERGYSSWQNIKDNFESWNDVKTRFKTWEEVLMYIPK